jgi:hypothetical protein
MYVFSEDEFLWVLAKVVDRWGEEALARGLQHLVGEGSLDEGAAAKVREAIQIEQERLWISKVQTYLDEAMEMIQKKRAST